MNLPPPHHLMRDAMKIRLTLDVSDPAREYLARLLPEAVHTKGRRLARAALERHLREYVASLGSVYAGAHDRPLTADEERDANEAITYLRAQGKTDAQIRAWLLIQRARLHFRPAATCDESIGLSLAGEHMTNPLSDRSAVRP